MWHLHRMWHLAASQLTGHTGPPLRLSLQILKLSSRWSMAVKGKPWTPLCYALAQGHAGMVPLLLAHAKKGKPEAAGRAGWRVSRCGMPLGGTALSHSAARAALTLCSRCACLMLRCALPLLLAARAGRVCG